MLCPSRGDQLAILSRDDPESNLVSSFHRLRAFKDRLNVKLLMLTNLFHLAFSSDARSTFPRPEEDLCVSKACLSHRQKLVK